MHLTEKKNFHTTLRVVAMVLAIGLVLGLWIGGAQPVAVNLFPWPWGKLAHVAIYGLLASVSGLATGLRGKKSTIAGFLFSVLVGALDEWHQLYLPGRHIQLSDVGFDTIGAAIGSGTLLVLERIRLKKVGSER